LEELFVALSIAEINHEAVSMMELDLTGLSQTERAWAVRGEMFLWTRDIASDN
jgi:hypothetical protein